MAKPKLALIPAAQGDKFYSVLPSDGVGDFDFTRGSSATRINAQGLIETVADTSSRLNYDLLNGKVVNCPHYLLEPASTNFITYSNNISQWTSSDNTVSPNVITSPDGGLNGGKVIVNNGATGANIRPMDSVAATSGLDYVFSVFVKAGEFDKINLDFSNAVFGSAGATFNLTSGILTDFDAVNVSQGIEDYGNGWYRCYLVAAAITNGSGALILRLDANGAGDGVKGLYVYGAQYEQKSFLTSYIPTTGTAITRAAESANGSGNAATFNDSEGVLMAEISAENETSSSARRISILNTTSNRILIGAESASSTIRTVITVGGSSKFDVSSSQLVTTNNKIAVKYSSNGSEMYINGFTVGISAIDSSFPSSTLNDLQFGSGNGNSPFYGKTRQIQYFDSALTDAQLETLTSWTSLQEMITSQLYTNY